MAKDKLVQNLRVHGDNILECEHALKLMVKAIDPSGQSFCFIGGTAYAPIYKIKSCTGTSFNVQLFPGYGRWKFDIKKYLIDRGAPLREATDAVITKLTKIKKESYEEFVLSLEFCGALPAGNNAWQRCGRALASTYASIPYLYFAEIGGIELDAARKEKAPRFPNPLVPFAYLTLGAVERSMAIPVFVPSPSSNKITRKTFDKYFGFEDALTLIRNLLLDEPTKGSVRNLQTKAEKIVQLLAKGRKRKDCIPPKEWGDLADQESGYNKAIWLIKKAMPWNKKTGIKNLTSSFKKLLKVTIKNGAIAIGSKDMPFCLISQDNRKKYGKELSLLYRNRVTQEFLNWISIGHKPLLCVWVAGFKPRGDDSRPDRGLVPLARMIFGRNDVDLLTIVYGPAKIITWQRLQKDMWELARINGLWEAIIGLSDGLLIDSPTSKKLNNLGYIVPQKAASKSRPLIKAARTVPYFGEHDVDSVLHLLFSTKVKDGIYEGLCNPPGGDWSGISIIDFKNNNEHRWTSLPRVSGRNTKRPDHLVQFKLNSYLLSIESKDTSSTLKHNIGIHLKNYVKRLIQKPPIAFRNYGSSQWQPTSNRIKESFNIVSGAAFRISQSEDLKEVSNRGKLDIVFGIDFSSDSKTVKIHTFFADTAKKVIPLFKKLASKFSGILEIEV